MLYLGPMSSIRSLDVLFRQLSLFVKLSHVLQSPRSYPRACGPFGADVQLQGLVTYCAAELVLGNLREEKMCVAFL